MTENEVIAELKRNIEMSFGSDISDEASKLAIKVIEEIKQYRVIGTVEEFREAINSLKVKEKYIKEILWERDIAIQQLEEIGMSLGEKMDSVKEAMERQMPKTPNIWGDGYDDKSNIIYDMYNCPNCGKCYEIGYEDYKYCPECGQAIDRSDLDKLV